MDIQKVRESFERRQARNIPMSYEEFKQRTDEYEEITGRRYGEHSVNEREWIVWLDAWQALQALAVPEQDQQIWVTCDLTWKDVAFRALSCKVLKTTQNWVHVKNIVGVGSTTASLICTKLGVNPDGTKFDLIEAQEST